MYRILVTLVFSCAYASFLDGDLELTDGVKLISVPISNSIDDEGRSFGDHSVLNRMAKFLQGHELQVKLPSLIEKEKITQVFAETLKAVDETYKESNGTGRGKGGGGGGVALLGLMFAKALGAAGIGGLGLLTMKLYTSNAVETRSSFINQAVCYLPKNNEEKLAEKITRPRKTNLRRAKSLPQTSSFTFDYPVHGDSMVTKKKAIRQTTE